MPRGSELYLDDILESIRRIEFYVADSRFEEFRANLLVQDGVARNLEVIGEAVKKLPEELKRGCPEIDWRKIAGLRDILAHEYASIELGIVWNVVVRRLPQLKQVVQELRTQEQEQRHGGALPSS